MKPKHNPFHIALAATVTVIGTATLHAQTAWDGGGGDTDYSNALNWAGDIIPGNSNNNGALIGDGSTQSVIYNTATNYTSIGTGKANSLMVGTGSGGIGSLTLSGDAGTLTFGGNGFANAAWIGTNDVTATGSTGTVTVSAGTLSITGGADASINLGVRAGSAFSSGTRSGTLIIDGGTVEVGRRILMGANLVSSVGLLTISSGTLDMKRTGVSGEGDLGMIRLGNGTNTVNLDGGTVIFSGFHVTAASSLRSTIFMNGTTLRANANISDLFLSNPGNANYRLKTGGLVLDTNGFNVTINDNLTQEAGHTAILRKEGLGTLTFSGTSDHTGTTTVSGGTLAITGANTYTGATIITAGTLTIGSTGSINDTSGVTIGTASTAATTEFNYNSSTALTQTVSFAAGSTGGTLSGNGTINQAVNVTAGNTLAIGNSVGVMNFAGGLTVGGTYLYDLTGGNTTADLGFVTGMLALDSTSTLDLVQLGTYTLNDKFTLFSYETGNLTGTFDGLANDTEFFGAGGMWRINYFDTTAGLNGGTDTGRSYVTITAIPEPTTALLGGLGLLVLLRRRRFIERIG